MRLSPKLKKEVDQVVNQYEFKAGAILPIMHRLQELYGYLSEDLLASIGDYLNIPPVDLFEVATFYAFFNTKPVGENVILVCETISCYLNNGEAVIAQLEKELGIKPGETTPDNKFTLQLTSCLGACDRSPAMMINDKTYFELTPEKISQILQKY
jgi:NADH-quinone oxidoreductase subunit E